MLPQISLWLSTQLQKRKQKKEFKRIESFICQECLSIDTLIKIDAPKSGTLIVKCDDIGDFLLWQQCIPHIVAHAPKPITFVGNSNIKPLLEEWFDFADHYIWIQKNQWEDATYRQSIYQKIRALNVELAFTTLFTRNFKMDDLMVYATAADRRVAWDRSHHPYFPQMSAADVLTNHTIKSEKPLQLEYFRHLELVASIFNLELTYEVKPLFPHFKKHKNLVVFPAANTKSRWWHPKKYATCIRELAGDFNQIYLLGGPNAIDYAKEIEQLSQEPKLMNLVGQTALTDLMTFIGEASVLLCPDTSAMHFAMLTETNTVVLSNGNNWQRFANYQPYVKSHFKIVFPAYFKPDPMKVKLNYSSAEIQAINVDQVLEAVRNCMRN